MVTFDALRSGKSPVAYLIKLLPLCLCVIYMASKAACNTAAHESAIESTSIATIMYTTYRYTSTSIPLCEIDQRICLIGLKVC
jgi:hypothetical protein